MSRYLVSTLILLTGGSCYIPPLLRDKYIVFICPNGKLKGWGPPGPAPGSRRHILGVMCASTKTAQYVSDDAGGEDESSKEGIEKINPPRSSQSVIYRNM